MKDATLSQALKWMFIAQILSIVGAFIPLIGVILIIIAFVLDLVALHAASKHDNGYHTAFILSIVGIVVSVVSTFAGDGFFATLVGIISTLVSLGIIYYVCTTTSNLLESGGNPAEAARGITVWKINLICAVASVVLGLLALIPVIGALADQQDQLFLHLVKQIVYHVIVFRYATCKGNVPVHVSGHAVVHHFRRRIHHPANSLTLLAPSAL